MAESKDFLKLQAFWYKKLARSGFSDIESESGALLNQTRPARLRKNIAAQGPEYYYQASSLNLQSVKERFGLKAAKAWKLHSEGSQVSTISKTTKLSPLVLHKLLKEIARTFGIIKERETK